jgi:gamma-glutamyl:cysteine ligase YbdK (ATP-grasp superfamily)
MVLTLAISEEAEARLKAKAAVAGLDATALAAELLEQAVARRSVDELLAPVRQQAADSGMSDDQLDDFLRENLQAVRAEQKARRP